MCSVSVVIPVFNEGESINKLLCNVKNVFMGHDYEIIVVDGDANKSTLNKIKDPNVKCIVSQKGRANQMNMGARVSSKNILFFVHADSIIPKNAFKLIIDALKKNHAGSFDLGINSNNFFLKIIQRTASLRSRLTKIPYGDQGLFIKKFLFFAIGGFSNFPIMEDIDIMQKLKRKRKKIIILKEKLITSPRKWKKEGIFYCSLRNILISSLFYLGASPHKLYRFYY